MRPRHALPARHGHLLVLPSASIEAISPVRSTLGRLHLSAVGLSELSTWGYKQADPSRIVSAIASLRQAVRVLLFDETCAEMLGQIRGSQLRQGVSYASIDRLIAATALVHGLMLVTHNTKGFARLPDLHLEDWIADE